ncbi:hypothetical protein [Acidisarcina polymorpha]|uniref:hypothetical protein n=1 Tax=Acidisarcina polymorpha TaxID=2211140 RepID=UPI00191C491A|nr:hypothetical protein [Acidisarcina polymorpha]
MTAKRVRKDGQPWHNNIGRWVDTLTVEQRSSLFQSSARAQWGPEKEMPKKADDGPWTWPNGLDRYDRSSTLTACEEGLLTRYAEAYRFYRYGRTMDFAPSLNRLVQPLNDTLDYTGIKTNHRKYVLLFFLREMAERKRSFSGWTTEEWIDSIERSRMERQHIVAIAYLLCDFADLHRLKCDHVVYGCLARKVFGRDYMKIVSDRVFALLLEWGYLKHGMSDRIMRTVFETLLFIRSPHLDQLTLEHLKKVIARKPPRIGSYSSWLSPVCWPAWELFQRLLRFIDPFPTRSLRPPLLSACRLSGRASAVSGLIDPRMREAPEPRAIASCSTWAVGSVMYIQRFYHQAIGRAILQRNSSPSSASGMVETGEASIPFMLEAGASYSPQALARAAPPRCGSSFGIFRSGT